jgi:hypothetical protein
MAPAPASRSKAGLVMALISSACIAAFSQIASAENFRRLVFQEAIEISRCERFVAAEEFSVGRSIGKRSVSSVGFNFVRLFLTTIETDAYPFTLQAWTLRYSADDPSLIARLGGEERVIVPLCAIHRLMEMSSRGESEARSNFAYTHSPVDNRLMAIHWFVNERNEWVVGAVDVPHSDLDWPSGSRVFSKAIIEAEDKPH